MTRPTPKNSWLFLVISSLLIVFFLACCTEDYEIDCPFNKATTEKSSSEDTFKVEGGGKLKVELENFAKMIKELNLPALEAEATANLLYQISNQSSEETYWGVEKVVEYNLLTAGLCSIYNLSLDPNLPEEERKKYRELLLDKTLELFALFEKVDSIDTEDTEPIPPPPPPPPPDEPVPVPTKSVTFIVNSDMENGRILLDNKEVIPESGSSPNILNVSVPYPEQAHSLVIVKGDRFCRKTFVLSPSNQQVLPVTDCKTGSYEN